MSKKRIFETEQGRDREKERERLEEKRFSERNETRESGAVPTLEKRNDDVGAIRHWAKRSDFLGSRGGEEWLGSRGSRLINIRAIKVLPRRLALDSW